MDQTISAASTRPALVPTSTTDLNCKAAATQIGRKRKRDVVEEHEPNLTTFITRPLSSVAIPAATFNPVTVLPRSRLPLSWLNSVTNPGNPPPGYLFEANIPTVKTWEQCVLVARLCPNGGLYAIEKISKVGYIAAPLHSWVTEQWCHDAASGHVIHPGFELLLRDRNGHQRTGSNSSNPPIRLPTPCSPKKPKNRRGALARMSILTPKDVVQTDPMSQISASPKSIEPLSESSDALACGPGPQVSRSIASAEEQTIRIEPARIGTQVAPETIVGLFENAQPLPDPCHEEPPKQKQLEPDLLRQHYFETLYLSKTSLAFYAKGPLNRARAQILSSEAQMSVEELTEFYRQTILPVKKMDMKYRESLSKVIQEIPLEAHEIEKAGGKPKKKSSKKKVKLGRDCLWSGEEEYITQWWRGRDLAHTTGAGLSHEWQADEMRKSISDLRVRENEMQLLLILEVVLLEKHSQKAGSVTELPPRHPDVKAESVEEESSTILAKIPPAKKQRDWKSEWGTIVDRLCIWHTVGSDELFASPERAGGESNLSTTKSKDRLRDFCANIIIPFYASKLPDQCKSICRKLGGPEVSPQRPKAQSAQAKQRLPPGQTTAKSNSRPVQQRTLERVLSEDQSNRHVSPPVLSRSATLPLFSQLKREPSELSVLQRPISQSGITKSVSFSNREIDLVAEARAQQAKRKKLDTLASQKNELKAAIDALKKPSRTTVANAFMDEMEQRTVDSRMNIGNRRGDQLIQISATPKKGKSRSFAREEPELPRLLGNNDFEDHAMIPSSTLKSNMSKGSSSKKRAVLSAIHETPSRGHQWAVNPLGLPIPIPTLHTYTNGKTNTSARDKTSEILSDPPLVAATPPTQRLRSDLPSSHSQASATVAELLTPLPRMTKSKRPVLFTPLRKTDVAVEVAFRDAPEIPSQAGKAMDRVMGGIGTEVDLGNDGKSESGRGVMSLYDELGWNNDDYDL